MSEIAVVYTARGTDVGSGPPPWRARLPRFIKSYLEHPPGIAHTLYVFYKNFETATDLAWAREQFAVLGNRVELLNHLDSKTTAGCPDVHDDVTEPILCPINASSEIMHDGWLKKLYDVFVRPDVGLVGCTGSRIVNIHVRDTAILVDRHRYFSIADQFNWENPVRFGPLTFEHGDNNLTIQIMRANLRVFVVEKERIIEPAEWGTTTYQGNLQNVLVLDRGARDYQDF